MGEKSEKTKVAGCQSSGGALANELRNLDREPHLVSNGGCVMAHEEKFVPDGAQMKW